MKIKAPFNEGQIKNIKEYQMNSFFHPFTCPYRGTHKKDGVLIPTKDGMICDECSYIQDWVHDFMTSVTYRKNNLKPDTAVRKLKVKKIIKTI